MAIFKAIDEPLIQPMFDVRGGLIRAQFVYGSPLWHEAMMLNQADQMPLRRRPVSLGSEDCFQNDTMVIASLRQSQK